MLSGLLKMEATHVVTPKGNAWRQKKQMKAKVAHDGSTDSL
jgi:hypothetical protein